MSYFYIKVLIVVKRFSSTKVVQQIIFQAKKHELEKKRYKFCNEKRNCIVNVSDLPLLFDIKKRIMQSFKF